MKVTGGAVAAENTCRGHRVTMSMKGRGQLFVGRAKKIATFSMVSHLLRPIISQQHNTTVQECKLIYVA